MCKMWDHHAIVHTETEKIDELALWPVSDERIEVLL